MKFQNKFVLKKFQNKLRRSFKINFFSSAGTKFDLASFGSTFKRSLVFGSHEQFCRLQL